MTTTPSRFESSFGNRVIDLLLLLSAATLAAFAIARFGVGNLTGANGALPVAAFLVALLIGAALSASAFVFSRVTITVTPTTVEVVRGRKLQHSLSRDVYSFASPVPGDSRRRLTSERILTATSPRRQLTIACRLLSKSTFEQLVAALQTAPAPELLP